MNENNDTSEYKVELDTFSGPLDLLLFLIRREEVDLWNIPISRIVEQYVKYLDMMSELNINVAGEFIVMAATLIEIKSRLMTPDPAPAEDEEPEDPRMELVRQLMEYKRFKEAAVALSESAEARAARFARAGGKPDADEGKKLLGAGDVTLWALLDAFSEILEQTGKRGDHRLVLDTMPQEQIQAQLENLLKTAGRAPFSTLFEGRMTRIRLVGTFIALLELVKRQILRVEQEQSFGEIWINYVPEEERVLIEPEAPPMAETLEPAGAPAQFSPADRPDQADPPDPFGRSDQSDPSDRSDPSDLTDLTDLSDFDLPEDDDDYEDDEDNDEDDDDEDEEADEDEEDEDDEEDDEDEDEDEDEDDEDDAD